MKRFITIIHEPIPAEADVNRELQWLGRSLGLFGQRDKEGSCFRIFIILLKAAKVHHPISSDEIAANLKLTRGTVVHHLNRLMSTGIALREREKYVLRSDDLHELVNELKRDMEKSFKKMERIAEDIDTWMGLR